MDYPFYTDKLVENCRQTQADLPPPPQGNRPGTFQPDKDYLPDTGLVDAVNAALLLRQPLLLTGEPGTGKTQLAYHLACQLGYKVLKFETKSDSKSRDLFYTYDALGRFQAGQLKETDVKKTQDYITYNALGLAILLANDHQTVKEFLPTDFEDNVQRILDTDFDFTKPQRFIVLIDEIDKAPRDFPNDILNEVEKSYFRVPELGKLGNVPIETSAEMQPILLLTSNSEKSLPNAFLRRCIYYDIPFPEAERLRKIVEIRLAAQIEDINQFLNDALTLFYKLRESLRKKPSTAELLNWLLVLREMFKEVDNPFIQYPKQTIRTMSTLVKTAEDQKLAERILEKWRD